MKFVDLIKFCEIICTGEDVVNLFKTEKEQISRIVIQVKKDIDLLTQKGYEWLLKNPRDHTIEYFKGSKTYTNEHHSEIFDLIVEMNFYFLRLPL